MLVFFVLPGCKQKEVSNVQEKNKLVISVKDMTPPAIKIKEPVRIKIGTSDFDIRDYFTECLWKNSFVDVLDGIVHIFF